MSLPWDDPERDIAADIDDFRAKAEKSYDSRRAAELEHFKACDCHDSWDQCPCAEDSHPLDGSCGCCPLGTGLCGPLPLQEIRDLPEAAGK